MNSTVRKLSDFGCEVSKTLFTKESHPNLPVRKLEGQDMATSFWMRLPFVCLFLADNYLQWEKYLPDTWKQAVFTAMQRNPVRFPNSEFFVWAGSQSTWLVLPNLQWQGIRENSSIVSGWPGWPSRSSSLACLVILKHIPGHAVALQKAQAQTEQCGICIWMEQSEMWDEDASKIRLLFQKHTKAFWQTFRA